MWPQIFNEISSCVRFEVPTAVTMKITIFWDITQSTLRKDYWFFEGTCCLYLVARRITSQKTGMFK
jgi:hypothetical protein